jgi:valyl-tRNA synthetase
MAPPNLDNSLHKHASSIIYEDALARWHRMCGRNVLWMPCFDHGGMKTENFLERLSKNEEKKTRHEYGKEEFVKKLFEIEEILKGAFTYQIKRLGATIDWSREYSTIDEKSSKFITEAFFKLHQKGKIFRESRLINWDFHLKTVVNKTEIEYIEITKRKEMKVPGYDKPISFGEIISFIYLVKETNEEIIVSTTRPETILADTAVAIHPDDSKHKNLIGKELIHPFIKDRKIIVIEDKEIIEKQIDRSPIKSKNLFFFDF